MPCNCSGVRMKKCSCKVFGYPLGKSWQSETQNVVLVEEDQTAVVRRDEKLNFFIRGVEHIYDKCAGYNLRYCPLRGRHRQNKHFTNALKDLFILLCFVVANFIVFLNISSRVAVHTYFFFRDFIKWIERYTQTVLNRHLLKSQCDQSIIFNRIMSPAPDALTSDRFMKVCD